MTDPDIKKALKRIRQSVDQILVVLWVIAAILVLAFLESQCSLL